MSVAPFTQPDYTSDNGSEYPTNIDNAISVLARHGAAFAPRAQTTPNMTVRVDAGYIWNGTSLSTVAAQNTSTITAPVTNPRIDRIVIDASTGAVSIIAGSENVSPSAPSITSGKMPVAQVNLTVGMTEITNADLTDERVLGGSSNSDQLDAISEDILRLALSVAELEGDRYNMAEGIADPFSDEGDVDTGTSTNETYDAGGDFYEASITGGGAISGATGTAIGDMTGNGGLAASFDGNTNQAHTAGSQKSSTTNAYIGKNYSASPKKISHVVLYGVNNSGFTNTNPTVTIKLYGKNGGAPSNGTDGTELGSISFTDTADATSRQINSNQPHTTWDYIWVYLSHGIAAESMFCAEVIFHETGNVQDMDLRSNAFTAAATPDLARLALFVGGEDASTLTLNTDLIGYVSRNGGTNWTTATLEEVGELADGTKIFQDAEIDISSQPSGSSMKWRVATDNASIIELTAVVLQWG